MQLLKTLRSTVDYLCELFLDAHVQVYSFVIYFGAVFKIIFVRMPVVSVSYTFFLFVCTLRIIFLPAVLKDFKTSSLL